MTNDLVHECCSAQVSLPLPASQFKLCKTNFSDSPICWDLKNGLIDYNFTTLFKGMMLVLIPVLDNHAITSSINTKLHKTQRIVVCV